MTFSVNLTALAGLPASLDRRNTDLTAASHYLAANTILRDGAGLANMFGIHQRVQAGISNFLDDNAAQFALTDAMRVRAAISSYRRSDARAAQRADAAIPDMPSGLSAGPPLTASDRADGPSIFDDEVQPSAMLTKPASHYADMPYQPSWFDLLSPSSLARDAIWKITSHLANFGLLDRPYDPFEMLVEPFVGDWAGLLRCAEVFDHISQFITASAQCILDVKGKLPHAWTGNVAGMCGGSLEIFSTTLSAGIPPLRSIAKTYRDVAQGVQDNANLLEMLVTMLVDDAADGVLDCMTFGTFSIYDVGNKARNFVKTLTAAARIAGNVADLVSAGFTAANDAVSRLGILRETAMMPVLRFPTPQIPVPGTPTSISHLPTAQA